MSAKLRARRAHARHKARQTDRREMGLFFGRGQFPRDAVACMVCTCGARAYTKDLGDFEFMEDFDLAHSECGMEVSA